MAIITTKKTIGWYGVHGATPCEEVNFGDIFGKYSASKQFIPGTSGLSESESSAFKLMISFVNDRGAITSWTQEVERNFGNLPKETRDTLPLPFSFVCGTMYIISWEGEDLNVPNFVPTNMNVDMGRLSN